MSTITVDVRALTAEFQTDMKRAAKQAKASLADIEKAGKAIGATIGAGAAVGITALVALTKQSINAADELSKMAQKVGVGVGALSTLAYAADQAGVGVGALQGGLVRLAKNASDTAQGIGTASDAFRALGIDVKNGDGSLKNADVLLLEIADSLSQYEDGANKTALAVALLGKSGAAMIPLINGGSEAIRKAQERAKAFGLELTEETAKSAEQFNDLLSDMGYLAKGLGNDVARGLLPGLNALAEQFVDSGVKGRKAAEGSNLLADGIKATIGVAITSAAVIQKLGATVGAVFQQVGTFASLVKTQAGALVQYQKDVLDIGPYDAFAKLLESGFDNAASGIAQAGLNLDALNDSFKDIDEEAERRVAALATTFVELKKASDPKKGPAPGLTSAAEAAKLLAAQAKEAAKQLKAMQLAQDRAVDVTMRLVDEQEASQQQTDNLIADLKLELDLIGKSNIERAKANALRQLGATATKEEAEAVEQLAAELALAAEADSILAQFEDSTPIFNLIDDIGTLQAELERVGDAMSEAFDPKRAMELKGAISQLNDQVAIDTLGSFKALLGAVQTFSKEGSGSFQKIETALAALSIVQDILALKAAVTAVLTQGQGEPYSAFARMAAMAAAVAPFIASIGLTLASLGGSGGPSTAAADNQASQGTGTVLGDAEAKSESILNAAEITADATSELVGINLGMLRALQSLQSSLGNATNMLARGSGEGFSALPGDTEWRGLFGGGPSGLFGENIEDPFNLLGGSSEVTDQGIVIAGNLLEGILIGAFQDVESRRSIFSSRRTRTEEIPVAAELEAQFQLIIDSLVDTVREGALALGLLPAEIEEALAAFALEEIRISLKDLTAEEQQAELLAVFSAIFDGLAGEVVPFIAQFQQVGEGLGETLVRVATGVQVTREAMIQLGFSLDELDPEAFAQVSEGLIEMSGGLESFISGMQTFVRAFGTEEHQFEVAQDALTRAFAQAGLTIPATREAMFELMQSLDATTESGREQIATLLRLAGVADDYYSLLDQRNEAAADAAQDVADELARIAEEAADAAEALAELRAAQREAAQTYVEFIAGIAAESNQLTEFGQAMADASQWRYDAIGAANEHARAAGLAGVREQDLAVIEMRAAELRAEAIAALRTSIAELAQELGYTQAGDTVDSLNARIAELQGASQDAAAGIAQAVESIRGQLDLLLGDLSPFNDRRKLEIARGGLQSGSVTQEQFLQIARRLFGSSRRYVDEFNFAQGFPGSNQDGSGGIAGGRTITSTDTRSIAELEAIRDALLEQQRGANADQLARRLAELGQATGEEFSELAAGMGFSVDQLAADLNLSNEQLQDYLETLSEQFGFEQYQASAEYIANAINIGTQRIVDAVLGTRTEELYPVDFAPINGSRPDLGGAAFGRNAFGKSEADDEATALLSEVRDLLERIAPAAERSAAADEAAVPELVGTREEVTRLRRDRESAPRSTRGARV